MLHHADSVLRQWAKELGEIEWFDRLKGLQDSYQQTFEYYLTGANTDRDDVLLETTHGYYNLADDMFAKMRLKRGEAPTMYGFGPDNRDSAINYFGQSVTIRDEELDWLYEIAQDDKQQGMAICLVAALAANIRCGFREKYLLCLVAISELHTPVAEQALAQVIILLAQYDLRIDFFPEIQDRMTAIVQNSNECFYTLGAMIRSVKKQDVTQLDEEAIDNLPEELYDALDATHENMQERLAEEMNRIEPFMREIAEIMPDTWIFSLICDTDRKRESMARMYVNIGMQQQAFEGCMMNRTDIVQDDELRADMLLYNELYAEALDIYEALDQAGKSSDRIRFRIGWCALLTGEYELAEQYMIGRLRQKNVTIDDYINYGHLCWVRGDRLTAYENYREARRMSNSIKRFKESFCPDRKLLTQMGIPLDQVYLMEDNLVRL